MSREQGVRIDGFDGEPLGPNADALPFDDLSIRGEEITLLRLECMDDGVYWGRVYLKDKPDVVLHFSAKRGKLMATVTRE